MLLNQHYLLMSEVLYLLCTLTSVFTMYTHKCQKSCVVVRWLRGHCPVCWGVGTVGKQDDRSVAACAVCGQKMLLQSKHWLKG